MIPSVPAVLISDRLLLLLLFPCLRGALALLIIVQHEASQCKSMCLPRAPKMLEQYIRQVYVCMCVCVYVCVCVCVCVCP